MTSVGEIQESSRVSRRRIWAVGVITPAVRNSERVLDMPRAGIGMLAVISVRVPTSQSYQILLLYIGLVLRVVALRKQRIGIRGWHRTKIGEHLCADGKIPIVLLPLSDLAQDQDHAALDIAVSQLLQT